MARLTCLRWAVTHHSSASWQQLTHIQRDMNMSHYNAPAASQWQCMLTQANNAKTNKIQVSSDITVLQVVVDLCTSRLTQMRASWKWWWPLHTSSTVGHGMANCDRSANNRRQSLGPTIPCFFTCHPKPCKELQACWTRCHWQGSPWHTLGWRR